jgi:hypothetical protein
LGALTICFVVVLILICCTMRRRRAGMVAAEKVMVTSNRGNNDDMEMQTARQSYAARSPQFACTFCKELFFTSAELQDHIHVHKSAAETNYGQLQVTRPIDDDITLTRDSRHAEPAYDDPSLTPYSHKSNAEFDKYQADY